jgi:predicted transcriptional regulator
MAHGPITVTLTEWQKLEALKRVRERYTEELAQIEAEITEILTACAEADHLVQYLGEQPEVLELRGKRPEAEAKEKRRQYVLKLVERLDQVIPKQPEVKTQVPGAGPGKPGSMRKF